MSYVWRAGSKTDNPTLLDNRADFGPRAAITAVFLLGAFYFAIIVRTFRSYSIEANRKADVEAIASSAATTVRLQGVLVTSRLSNRASWRNQRIAALDINGELRVQTESFSNNNELGLNSHVVRSQSTLQENESVEIGSEVEISVEPPSPSSTSFSSSTLSTDRVSVSQRHTV